eukprot:TRINITY_DN11800_c0_g1_i1.p1 TRINITY_DN11800_c0_g1~~TRINITY_DN11800_c0_g1_i1.p1  ORF type:complete len:133 (+),score=16.55 TRINITY_DN11800_c0_g1_i1:48-446(+)
MKRWPWTLKSSGPITHRATAAILQPKNHDQSPQTHTHIYTYTYTYTHIHTHTHTYTHIHTHSLSKKHIQSAQCRRLVGKATGEVQRHKRFREREKKKIIQSCLDADNNLCLFFFPIQHSVSLFVPRVAEAVV